MKSFALVTTFVVSVVLFVHNMWTEDWIPAAGFFLSSLLFGYAIFNGTMNLVQNVGPIYWITRDTGKPTDKLISHGFMRQIGEPWLVGTGVQTRFGKYVVQVGICHREPVSDEMNGILNAMKGRMMDKRPKEIGKWR